MIRCGRRVRTWGGPQWWPDREPHDRDLLLLGDDDFLSQATQLLVMAIAQQRPRHIDGALMMRYHHRHEVTVGIARRLHIHIRHHLVHGGGIFRDEWRFRRRRWRLRQRGRADARHESQPHRNSYKRDEVLDHGISSTSRYATPIRNQTQLSAYSNPQ